MTGTALDAGHNRRMRLGSYWMVEVFLKRVVSAFDYRRKLRPLSSAPSQCESDQGNKETRR